jgi:hydroxymethylglutaryl-CoA synthase
MNKIGISDLGIYIPSQKIDIQEIFKQRISQDPGFERRLKRAIEVTGQKQFVFPISMKIMRPLQLIRVCNY